jgi:preprotein translocase subunit SecA
MLDFLKNIFGDESQKVLKKNEPIIAKIHSFLPVFAELSPSDFPLKTQEFKKRLAEGASLDDLLPEAFALVYHAFARTMDIKLHDVQFIGGIIIHQGAIAEMRTGEGKTFTSVLPAYLNALTGKGVHIVAPNDYLAKRDAGWVGEVFNFLGVRVAAIADGMESYMYDENKTDTAQGSDIDEMRDETGSFKVFDRYLQPCTRKQAYDADVTYGTNNQFGFDYLRDNTQKSIYGLVQRVHTPHAFAIVDEVDSILIDEARVPLILSTKSTEGQDVYPKFARIAAQLEIGADYDIDEKLKSITLTDAGMSKAEKILGIDNLYTDAGISMVHHLEAALKAKSIFLRDRDYVVKDNQVIIVDPFTGRMQDGRRWSEGLHQAVEAKEGVVIGAETKTLASITYQNYFKFYDKLAGMTGTAMTSSEEFFKVYGLNVVEIPTHKPVARIDNPDLIFQTETGKFKAIARAVKELHAKGQPVLIGTVAIEKNELLSAYLTQEGVPHNALNAKNHEREGEIVAQAGRRGAVTIATNMAGRGVDIKLGGNPATAEDAEEIKNLGGLYVIGTERHDARRIDNQLRGRSGRQGDPGETQFYVSLDDPLMRVFGSDKVKSMIGALGIAEDEPIKNGFISSALEKAQEKIEGFNFDARKHVLAYDDVLSYHRDIIYTRRRSILRNDKAFAQNLFQEIREFSSESMAAIDAKKQELGNDEIYFEVLRQVSLSITDKLWMEHLQVMDHTRQSVNLRAYGQREPVVEYKKEGLRLFREMEFAFKHQVASIMGHLDIDQLQRQQSKPVDEKPNQATVAPRANKDYKPNDQVVIEKQGEQKVIKYKKLDEYLATGWVVKQ